MIRARLRLRVPNERIAEALVRSVEPDNEGMRGLQLVGRASEKSADFQFKFRGRIETFIFTLDDMLECLQAVKHTLRSLPGNGTE